MKKLSSGMDSQNNYKKGENIYFESLSTNDIKEIHNYASDEEVSRFIGWNLMNILDETREYIETMLIIEDKY